MGIISTEKSGEHFRLLYDVKGRFAIHRITPEEASYTETPYSSPLYSPFIDMSGGMSMNTLLAERMPPLLQHPDLEEANAEAISKAGHDPMLALKGLEIVRRELSRNGEQ